jgi:hypothetical protein
MEATHFIDKEPDTFDTWVETTRQDIELCTEDQIIKIVESCEKVWGLGVKQADFRNARELGYRQFIHPDHFGVDGNPEPNSIDLSAIKDIQNRNLIFMVNVKDHAKKMDILLKEYEGEDTLEKRINDIVLHIHDGYHNIRRHYISYERVENNTKLPMYSALSDPTIMNSDKIERASPLQKCLIFTLDQLYKAGYRRYGTDCYEEIRTVEGYRTRAWSRKCTIEKFIRSLSPMASDFDNWENFTSRGNVIRDVVDNISKGFQPQFPDIVKRRHVWSFTNGVFVGKEWIPETETYDCRFYPYESDAFKRLDPTIIACKYFDQVFQDYTHVDDWTQIPTPHVNTVLQYQNFEDEACNWVYVMGGRLCFDIGEMDTWQIIPFFKGIARSGKSTLITKVFKRFYDGEDIGTLSNNIEKKFGLSAIYKKLMFIAPEIKGDLALEQAEFQSIVSGEDVSVAVKNEKAQSIEWTTPGILGGNEIPNWKDNSGSVLRRILAWNFGKQVRNADPQLDLKLRDEMPRILLKCVRAYLDYSNKYRNKDIWDVVPDYFKTIQKQVAMVASSLHNFMESTNIVYGPDKCVPQKEFIQRFNQHCKENNLGNHKFHQDFYAGPFSSRDIEVRNETIVYRDIPYPIQPIIYGLDLVNDTLAFSSI